MKRTVPFIILSIFVYLMVVLVVPGLFKPTRESSIQGPLKEREGSGIPEDTLVQKIRDEVVFKRLSEMALREEPQPPLPRVSLFPTEKPEEQEKMRILKNSRFYHEVEEIIQEEERQQEFFNVPRPQIGDVKGGDIPVPEDVVAKEFIASLRATVQEEEGAQKKNAEDTALDIRGPAASRKINYIPPPLQPKPSVDGDILLKFWVFPDGTVGKVVPLIAEDTRVYTAAINHVKQYRFEPLPKDSPQVETWGVIPVKSVLR
jgi:outer membrane biosynthesis protein TonB